jgi:kynurenine formamidase
MKFIDLTIPLGIGTPPWPTYEPLQVKYFKRLAPNGANGQVVTHSNHVGTHLDGEIHFYTPGKDIAQLDFDFLTGEAAIVDLRG